MRFTYTYKTSDGVRHESVIEARSKDKAFELLRAQGIRPIKVVAPPRTGLAKLGYRGGFIVLLVMALVALTVIHRRTIKEAKTELEKVQGEQQHAALRHFIGKIDPSSSEVAGVFRHPVEAYLACYAQPGESVSVSDFSKELEDNFPAALADTLDISEGDAPEVRELKQVVLGLKEEARRFIRVGGSPREYIMMIQTRQANEVAFRSRFVNEYAAKRKTGNAAAAENYRASANVQLKVMGMRPLE